MSSSCLTMNSLVSDMSNSPLLHDGIAALLTLAIALSWLAAVNQVAARGWMPSTLSRKIIHIGTGPIFVLCWPLFSAGASARYWAALVPLMLTLGFLATGLGWIENPDLVKSSTRNGVPGELLRGPLYYGIVFVVCTVLFWRESPVGILALMVMCGGDGLADVVGRRWGSVKLPFSPEKSWAGSAAMFLGSLTFGIGYLILFEQWGYVQLPLPPESLIRSIGAIALAATLVEAVPIPDVDNITLTATVVGLGLWLLQ